MALRTRRIRKLFIYVPVAFFCFFSASPFIVMIINTFKQDADLYRPKNNPFIYNIPPTLEHLELLFLRTNYPLFLKNSLLVGVPW